MMDISDIRTLTAVAGLDRALALFPDEVARAVALVAAQRIVLCAGEPPRGEGATPEQRPSDGAAS